MIFDFGTKIKGLLIRIDGNYYIGSDKLMSADLEKASLFQNGDEGILEIINQYRKQGINARLIDVEIDDLYGVQAVDCTPGYIRFGLLTE